MDALELRYLRDWLKIPKSATRSVFTPAVFNLEPISKLAEKVRVASHTQMREKERKEKKTRLIRRLELPRREVRTMPVGTKPCEHDPFSLDLCVTSLPEEEHRENGTKKADSNVQPIFDAKLARESNLSHVSVKHSVRAEEVYQQTIA